MVFKGGSLTSKSRLDVWQSAFFATDVVPADAAYGYLRDGDYMHHRPVNPVPSYPSPRAPSRLVHEETTKMPIEHAVARDQINRNGAFRVDEDQTVQDCTTCMLARDVHEVCSLLLLLHVVPLVLCNLWVQFLCIYELVQEYILHVLLLVSPAQLASQVCCFIH